MNITHALSGSRGVSNLASRIGTVASRFGFTSAKFEALMKKYSSIAQKSGCTATLPITAVIMKRHPDLVRRFNQKGIEFAIHGYVHIDYQQLPGKDQIEHYRKAVDTFNECRVPFTGFRAPYLRCNSATPFALSSLNFDYDSSHAIYWNVLQKTDFSRQDWFEYLRLLDYYKAQNALDSLSLPRFSGNGRIIEIPVSIPDDEAMVERLGITDEAGVTRVWLAILQETYRRGELFTLQLHPERIEICGNSLSEVINEAKSRHPGVWITTLKEIAHWWQEKEHFAWDIQPQTTDSFHVRATCSDRATLLVRNCSVSCELTEWYDGYQVLEDREFILKGDTIPVIGLGINTSPDAARFLQNEGFAIEVSSRPEKYGLYFNHLEHFRPADEKKLLEAIAFSDAPLVRFWRWPERSRSALTVTGDIDSITLFDFALRLLEARQHRKKQKYHSEVARAGATS